MTAARSKGQIFVISGPPGAGKSSVLSLLRAELPDLNYSISYTTRAPRPGETNGVDYNFVSRQQFEQMIGAGDMVEHVEVFGHLYGTADSVLNHIIGQGLDLLLDIEVDGAAALKARHPHGVFIFLLPPSRRDLNERIYGRGTEDTQAIKNRLARLEYELAQAQRICTHVVINDELQTTVQEVSSIIRADRQRLERLPLTIAREWGFAQK